MRMVREGSDGQHQRPGPGLVNLKPAEPGNTRAVTHGAHSERLIGPVASDVAEEVELLCAGSPAGEAQFAAARALLARKLARLRMSANTSKRTTTARRLHTREAC